MKKLFLVLLMITFSYSNVDIEYRIYYEKIDNKNKELSQKKIETSYIFGIQIAKEVLLYLNNQYAGNKSLLKEECNDTLYLAIFENSIVDDLGRTQSLQKFKKDCLDIVNNIN